MLIRCQCLRFGSLLILLTSGLLAGSLQAQNPADFPRPAELEPAIRFWTRVYTEIDTNSGFLHDSNNLAVIYKRVDYDRPLIEQQRKRIQEDLKVLASGKRTGLTGHQQQLLEAWPAGVTNDHLAQAVNTVRFQLGQSDRFVEGLIRSGAYRQHIEQVTAERNLPIELSALPHVESSFHPGAYSHANAAGMWQFIRSTGQRFMRIDHIVDERMDPYTATYAAMSLLEYNYSVLGTWPLALTAYNHGAGGLARAVREVGSNRIEDVIAKYRGPNFGFASRNFYPQFLAVMEVEKQAQALFGILQLDSHPEYEEFELDGFVEAETLARVLGLSIDQLKFDNPALRPVVWEGSKRIPKGYTVKVQKNSLKGELSTLLTSIPSREMFAIQTPDLNYVVQRGDSLSAIASRFNTSVARLVSINQLRDAHRIRVGQNLILPTDQATAAIAAQSTPVSLPAGTAAPDTYNVRRGDTLSTIARRFGLAEQTLLAANGIDNPDRIYPGQTLRLKAEVRNEPVAQPVPQTVAYVPADVPAAPIEPQIAAEEPAVDLLDEELPLPETSTPVLVAEQQAVDAQLDDATSNEQLAIELSADPSDYSVRSDNTIEIQATETLGHYAEWLGVRAANIRAWNGLRFGQPVVMGDRLKLNFAEVDIAGFELQRRNYHLAQQQEFFRRYRIQDLDQYQIAANDNISTLAARKYSVPIWLLRQYNPELDFDLLRIGQTVVFPVLAPVAADGQSS